MYFYFAEESLIYPELFDLDYFFHDNEKLIHVASGGVRPVGKLELISFNPIFELKRLLRLRRRFKIVENPEVFRDNIESIASYRKFFNLMAIRGIYSYDKVDIDDPDCYKFQLISYPIYNVNIEVNDKLIHNMNSQKKHSYDFPFKEVTKPFPTNNRIFDLRDFVI